MRPRLLIAVFLLCCATSLLAQTTDDTANTAQPPTQSTPPTNPPKPPPATAHITGTVLCDDTHRPARGAMVMALRIPKSGAVQPNITSSMARVATDGTYSVDHLTAGDYTVIALLPGYLSPLDDVPLNDSFDIEKTDNREAFTRNGVVAVRDNETAHMDVTIRRGAILSGRVTYSDGAPATQTSIYIEDVNAKPTPKTPPNPGGDQGMGATPMINAGSFFRSFMLHQNQGTNDQGDFRISGVRPGTYRVSAILPSPDSGSDAEGLSIIFGIPSDSRSLRIYSGDTLHKNAAKTYELRAGDDISGIDITIPAYIFHRVQGQLTALDGRPIFTGALTLTDASDDSFVLHTSPAHDGTFIFPEVPAGTYKLAVTGAKLGTIPDGIPEGMPVQAPMLLNAQAFSDTTTTILVKDSDITDLSIQLPTAAPSSNQPASTAAPTAPTQ
jgi:hypothetical protein